MDEREEARAQYMRQMLGVGRPRRASNRATSMVDRIIATMSNIHNRTVEVRSASHFEAVLKDVRKALLRYIGSLEHGAREVEILEDVAVQAALVLDGKDEEGLKRALRELKNLRDADPHP